MTELRRASRIRLRDQAGPDPMAWEDICNDATWQGRWVALDDCAYNEAGEATAGLVVDYDDDLAELCARLSAERRKSCSVVFCPPAESAA
ncbi:MAG: hypothetical protein OEV36_02835 [Myxococcales bacterium]|nr:hypothetical protein [Myxococcales bacterium]